MIKTAIAGQEIELTDGGNLRMHIGSLFVSAGKKYKFEKNSPGISINEGIIKLALMEDRMIFLTIGESKIIYMISPKEVMDIVEAHNSIYVKGDLRLFVIPIKALRRADGKKSP